MKQDAHIHVYKISIYILPAENIPSKIDSNFMLHQLLPTQGMIFVTNVVDFDVNRTNLSNSV